MGMPAEGTDAFEAQFAQEIAHSERMRLAVVAGFFGLLMLFMPAMVWLYREDYLGYFGTYKVIGNAMAVCSALVAYELFARYMAGRFLQQGLAPPRALRFLNAFIETSVPSLLIVGAAQHGDPLVVMQGGPAFLYGVFIVLSTLRLDRPLSIFTGLVAAIEYGALAFYYSAQVAPGPLAVLGAPGFIVLKSFILALSGFAAGFVAGQLRRRIRKAFQAQEERSRVLSAFGQQVSPAVAEEILKQGAQIKSRRSFVCVMFMDIRDFTPLAEKSTPEEIVALQNEIFGVAVEVVNRHHGLVNQFLGDGFMATFGAPLSTGEDCRNAVAAARELVARITQVRIGIGLHAGDAVSGNIGSELRRQYSITGNVVILASRIEQLNKQFGSQLLVSGTVLERSGDQAGGAAPLGPVRVKGREDAIEIYRLA